MQEAEQPEAAWAASPLLSPAPGHMWAPSSDVGADFKTLALAAQRWGVPATIPPATQLRGFSKAIPDCDAGRAASPALVTSRLLGPCSLPGRSCSPRLPLHQRHLGQQHPARRSAHAWPWVVLLRLRCRTCDVCQRCPLPAARRRRTGSAVPRRRLLTTAQCCQAQVRTPRGCWLMHVCGC